MRVDLLRVVKQLNFFPRRVTSKCYTEIPSRYSAKQLALALQRDTNHPHYDFLKLAFQAPRNPPTPTPRLLSQGEEASALQV